VKNYKDLTVSEGILLGLTQVLEYERGDKIKARSVKISVEPVPDFKAEEIKEIRNKAGMTQTFFAAFFGVSKKTVEAWEAGTNKPTGPARRLLSVMLNDPKYAENLSFIHSGS